MIKYHCRICSREFSTASGLTRHANSMHQGRTMLSQAAEPRNQQLHEIYSMQMPEHDENLWNTPITNPLIAITSEINTSLSPNDPSISQVDDIDIEIEAEDEPRYYLRSQVQNIETEEDIGENVEDIETEPQLSVDFKETDFDLEDLQGASLDDALDTIEGKNKPEHIAEWPNDVYREFMELIVEGNISNKIGDKIIQFFNKHSNLEKSPLPKSTKNGKDYLNQINSPSINFKEKTVATYSGVDFKLYYRPIFRAIQTLVQRPEVADNFVHKGVMRVSRDNNSETRKYGEPYECDWWLETEKSLPPMNHLLSVILYSDATTFDGLGKTSGHPVFLTLGNLPNRVRNSPESKVLLGFLPRVQDSGIKVTESFRSLQRETFHKCFDIMLRPLLEKPDALYFGIKGREMMFAARISFFLSDMLEADDITATYKSARCKMPCHTCMVLRNDLNKMDLESAASIRTHENMQQIIKDHQEKDYSVHSTENAFWKFP
jgi:hypothetical protein